MANLAIIGHPLEGNKVIEILKMLGGRDVGYNGLNSQYYYYIDEYGNIAGTSELPNNKIFFVIYTLEEFLEKFPYKVGDKVLYYKNPIFITQMEWIEDSVSYHFYYKGRELMLPSKHLQPYKELETMEEQTYLNSKLNKEKEKIKESLKEAKRIMEEIKIDIPKGYEFSGVDNDNQQVVFEKIKSKYYKTYEECYLILFPTGTPCRPAMSGCCYCYYWDKLAIFSKLLLCRDAYWKLAGDEMGLGKSWEPDWSPANEIKYVIEVYRNKVRKNSQGYSNTILAFPTAEMRDAFYENFKDLIEECKELL